MRDGGRSESVELMEALRRNFETIAMAKVSTSADGGARASDLWRQATASP